jgi:ABC-2 type transport system ATP-binding protein
MLAPAIPISRLTKDYGGGRGLFQLDLQVERERIFGFLGPNGAGKSTTIRLLMDMLRPTSGTASLLGMYAARLGGHQEEGRACRRRAPGP